jgi:hypothetical protein
MEPKLLSNEERILALQKKYAGKFNEEGNVKRKEVKKEIVKQKVNPKITVLDTKGNQYTSAIELSKKINKSHDQVWWAIKNRIPIDGVIYYYKGKYPRIGKTVYSHLGEEWLDGRECARALKVQVITVQCGLTNNKTVKGRFLTYTKPNIIEINGKKYVEINETI